MDKCNKIPYQERKSTKGCNRNRLKIFLCGHLIVYILLFYLPTLSSAWSVPFFGDIFSSSADQVSPSKVESHDDKVFQAQSSINPIINHDKTEFHPSPILRDAVDKSEVTVPTGNSSLLVVGMLVLGGLVITSVFLYALDVYATSRIDEYLYEYYGPELYDRYTSVYDPTPNTYYADSDSPYNSNGYYSATTASQYYGIRRSDERNTIGATSRILRWIENTMEMFDVASELLQDEKCQERLICEAYQREFMSSILGFDSYLGNMLEYFPLFQKAKTVSNHSKSRQGGCGYHYTGCPAINKAIYGTQVPK